ncbi:MAG: helix-turn-helix transcriptional regulator [Pseudobutyrivibrio sp.]|nr:helix-turn-helix transcriptional regulator [Pseudobutyrivibrio sp.]
MSNRLKTVNQLLDERKISQKEFSEKTGIPQSTISDWRKKQTNPASDKIMIICKVLDVTPEWLLSGIEEYGSRGNKADYYVIDRESDLGELMSAYSDMDLNQRNRLIGYAKALLEL